MAITDPRDISGLVAWYSADGATGYSDGAQMTTWADLSGNGNHATATLNGTGTVKPKWRSAGGPGGGPSVEFPYTGLTGNGGFFQLPNVMAASTGGGELVAYMKNGEVQSGWSSFTFGTSNTEYWPYSGTLYETFGFPARTGFAPVSDITNWVRYDVASVSGVASSFSAWVNEVSRASGTPGTFTWLAAPALGRSYTGQIFTGRMSCVIIYNRKLNSTERSDLATWLAAHPSGGTASSPAATGSGSLTLSGAAGGFTTNGQGAGSITLGSSGGGFPTAAGAGSLSLAGIGFAKPLHMTDVSNAYGGRDRQGIGVATLTVPVAPVPSAVSLGHRVDKAVAYPTPTMVDGRPT